MVDLASFETIGFLETTRAFWPRSTTKLEWLGRRRVVDPWTKWFTTEPDPLSSPYCNVACPFDVMKVLNIAP